LGFFVGKVNVKTSASSVNSAQKEIWMQITVLRPLVVGLLVGYINFKTISL